VTVSSRPLSRTHRGPWRRRLVLGILIVFLAFAAATARLFVWPDLPPLPHRADAIFELGGPGDRDGATLALAPDERAPQVFQSTTEADAASGACLPPIPGVKIECFHAVPETTRGEARYIGVRAAASHWKSVILVTTPDQAWRAQLRVGRCFPGAVYVETTPLPKWDWFRQIPYQWAATIKAELFQRDC
jgi:hypothetical protein